MGIWFGLTLLVIGSNSQLTAQTDYNAHLWVRGSIELQTSERWMFRQENYVRRSEWLQIWQSFVSRSVVQFRSPASMLWTLGYAYYLRFPYGAYNPRYTHADNQLMFMHQFMPRLFERVQPLLGTRFEYRFLEQQRNVLSDDSGTPRVERYFQQLSRVRFHLGIFYTFNQARTWRYEVFTESFFNFDRPVHRLKIAQSRIMSGFTHNLTPSVAVSAWLLHHWLRPTSPQDEQNYTLFLAINWRIKTFRESKSTTDLNEGEVR